MKIAGLDIGSTGCKLTIFDSDGSCLGKAYRDYPVKRTKTAHEVEAQDIIDSVFEVMEEMGRWHPDIAGIGVTSFGETFVLTDKAGCPLHTAMLYTDPRGADECRALEEELGSAEIAAVTGLKPHGMYSLPKIMWIKGHWPEVYRRAEHILLMEDFVVFLLTGTAQIDYSLATRTMAFDINTITWNRKILSVAGVDERLLSRPVPSGTAAGTLLPEAAKRTGFSTRLQVVSVSQDQVAGAVGAGVFDSGKALECAGTVECLTPVYDGMPPLEAMHRGNYAVVPYVVPGKYVTYCFSYTGGALIQWCADTLAKGEKELAAREGLSVHAYLERQAAEPTGLLVLPHFAGAAMPYMDTGSKGAIIGMTTATTVAEIYRGCMEGIAYEMLLNMEYLRDTGVRFKKLQASGGGAASSLWMQMKADVLNIPMTALHTADSGTVGSAMITGAAIGCFGSLQEAAAQMVREKETYYPDPRQHERYMEIYERYRQLYAALRPLV